MNYKACLGESAVLFDFPSPTLGAHQKTFFGAKISEVNPDMGRHAQALSLIRNAIQRRGTPPPNYVLSAALHAGGSVEQAIGLLESYAEIVSPRQEVPVRGRRGRSRGQSRGRGRGQSRPIPIPIPPPLPERIPEHQLPPPPPVPQPGPSNSNNDNEAPRCLGEIVISSEEEPVTDTSTSHGEVTISSDEGGPSNETSKNESIDYSNRGSSCDEPDN